MNNLQSKRKISIKTIILLICSFIMTTFAWFTYTKIVEPVLSIHMASWNIKYFIGEEELKNADKGIQIPIEALYPGMEEQQVIVDIYNHGEVLVDIEHEIKEIVILGTKYELVSEGGTPTSDNYITLLEPEITTDEETGDVIYKGPILYEPEKFPFTIELEHTTQVKPVVKDAEGKKVPGQGYLKITVNWLGDNDELDTEWGYKAGEYFANNPEATSAMSILVSVDSYQSADPGSITQIVLDKTTAEIRNGEELQIVATLNAGAQENLVWESSDESIAKITISEDNLTIATITGIKGGNATITAKSPDGSVNATCVVSVIQYISKITLDKENAEVVPGENIELTATVDEGAVDKLYWESSYESIATIETLEDSSTFSTRGAITTSGDLSTIKINGIKPGAVTITARNEDGTVKAECKITVQQLITFITLNPTTAEVEVGKTTTITATVDEGAVDNITWTSSNENIATVVGSGTNNAIATVKGVNGGMVTITAKVSNASGTITETCAVTVIGSTYIPAGFSVVSEETTTEGFTIADSKGNQYVWVEVPKTTTVYSTAGLNITEFTTDKYNAIENDLRTYTRSYWKKAYRDYWSSKEQHGLTSEEYTGLKQKMLKSVYKNGGFYVGKYETGIADSPKTSGSSSTAPTEIPVIKVDAYPYTYVTCSQAQTLASTKFDGGGYTTSLMFGVQWDLVLKYMATKSTGSMNSSSWGNFRNNTSYTTNPTSKYSINNGSTWTTGRYVKNGERDILLSTGASSQFSKQGIYDIAGNVWEWTLENVNGQEGADRPCAIRGRCFNGAGPGFDDGSDRYGRSGNSVNFDQGFRVVIF